MNEQHSYENWISLLEHHAMVRPEQIAFYETGKGASAQATRSIRYFELAKRAKTLAVKISQQATFGDRALIVMPAGIDYVIGFFACLYANVIAVTAFPPNSKKRDWSRLAAICADCSPALVLHNSAQAEQVDNWLSGSIAAIDINELNFSDLANFKAPNIDGNDIAFLQYSSGSTGNPKGVMLSHRNLLSNTTSIIDNYQLTAQDTFVNWLPLYHDMGFIGLILSPLLSGAQTWFMPSATVAQQPVKLLKLISQIGATVTAGPNFIFDLAVEKVTAEDKASLDLSTLRCFVNGAEPINAGTLKAFYDCFAACGLSPNALKPSYGMAEACLMVTATQDDECFKVLSVDKQKLALGKAVEEGNDVVDVACSGVLQPGIDVRIVHQGTRSPLPQGYVGEIMVKGDNITRGYWQKPEINDVVFDQRVDGQSGYMKTGDLGFIINNELYVSGRCKEMFIINGRNFYPQDIERTVDTINDRVLPHGCAIFEVATDINHGELVVVQELSRKGFKQADYQALVEQIIAQVAEVHELKLAAVILIRPLTLPKTTSGKIQRVACREAYLQGQLPSVYSWHRPMSEQVGHESIPNLTGTDEQSIGLWIIHWAAQRLSLNAEQLSPAHQLTQLGLDSIDAMTLTHELARQLNRELSVELCWAYPTIRELAQYLAQAPANNNQQDMPPMEGLI